MSVGTQPTSASVNNQLTGMALQLRVLMDQAAHLSTQVNGTGQGLAFLQSIGYSSAANPLNPGSISDAAYALQMIGYLNSLSQVYHAGTQATGFDYHNALAVLWNAQ